MRVAAIDQGTTSTRCLVVEEGGAWQLAGSRRHAQHYPADGWVEHDAEELLGNIRALLAEAGRVDAIGLANQGESCLAWDARTGAPLSRVIVWQDARTSHDLARLGAEAELRSKAVAGLPLDPYFSASKLAWLIDHVPAVSDALAAGHLRLGTTDAFFLDRLCGSFVTDLATASRTGLLDLSRLDWSDELCELYRIPRACLPRIVSVDEGFGAIDGVPVKASIVDQQAALYGHGCRAAGDAKITFGTGAFLLAVAGDRCPGEGALLPTIGWGRRGGATTYAIEGGVYDAGAAVEWARRVGVVSSLDELGDFSGATAISRGLCFVPALSGLAAPFWDRAAAPLFIGMQPSTERGDLARSVVEGIALLTARLVDEAASMITLGPRLSIDGGLSQSAYFAQTLASACGRTVVVPRMHELTALGLAEFCGLDVGATRQAARCFEPNGSVTDADRARFAEAVNRARSWRSL